VRECGEWPEWGAAMASAELGMAAGAARHAAVTVNGRVAWRNGSSAGGRTAVAVVVAGHAGTVAAAG
jgi:hypothetical protein